MTAEPQHFFVDALTGSDGTGAARSRLDVPAVFPDATAAFTTRSRNAPVTSTLNPNRARSQHPYPPPGPLVPSRSAQIAATRSMPAHAMPNSVSPAIPYNPWAPATTMDVAAAPVLPAAIPAAPVTQTNVHPPNVRPPNVRPPNVRPPNVPRPSAYGRTINQEAVYHRQPQLPPSPQAGYQVPAALMSWLPASVAAQIPAGNRPPAAVDPRIGYQPQQQPATQQFTASPQPNFRQQRLRNEQRPAQPPKRKSGSTGGFFVVLLLVLIFTGLGREILDAIFDALNR